MAILPVIRENPVQEVVEIRNRGSYTIPEEARKAHRLLVDVEVISVTRNQYTNLNYNLPQGEYGNVTYWSGASINRTEKIKYPSMRLIDWVNVEASAAFNAGLAADVPNRSVGALGLALGFPAIRGDRRAPIVWGYLTSHLKFVLYPHTQIRLTCQWYPWPDIEEFEEPDPDLDDPASGEDEYPAPRRNPPDDPWNGNAPSSGIDESRDPRDFDEANEPPPPPPLGEDCTRDYFIQAFITTANPDGSTSTSRCDAVLRGKILSISTKVSPDGGRRIAFVTRQSCEGVVEEVNLVNAPVEPPFSLTVESVTAV